MTITRLIGMQNNRQKITQVKSQKRGKANGRARVSLAVCARLVRRPIVHCLILGFSRLFTFQFVLSLVRSPVASALLSAASSLSQCGCRRRSQGGCRARAPAACCRARPCRLLPRAPLPPAAARAPAACCRARPCCPPVRSQCCCACCRARPPVLLPRTR
jgi:hypothetical protein